MRNLAAKKMQKVFQRVHSFVPNVVPKPPLLWMVASPALIVARVNAAKHNII
jgi:hypothetical protein